ncbi:MAG: CDP-diacylglycerol--serine O-phosphatidyltransferase [Phycisphaerales bacterium]|jgi:CDP-diacylglycerol---serine O-phosphatidyltransferase|nr:CDP-diacylglycerol--serine O-phosphatidyltransferase [Phycisphaerales bacterium]MBT7170967.1 CDP-diacylglycerol--serine O-phosphatidyltransferase [Phycisphaerales bacterium]
MTNDSTQLKDELVPREDVDDVGQRRYLQSTAVLPAFFTLLNAMFGFGAIHFATRVSQGTPLTAGSKAIDYLTYAVLLILAGMVCDMLDGHIARLTNSTSEFGAQLDSMCDVVTFGIAPAMITLRCGISILRSYHTDPNIPIERVFWCISALYVACAVLRLARFNVETERDDEDHRFFHGLPTPGAAAMVCSVVLLFLYVLDKPMNLHVDPEIALLTMSIVLSVATFFGGLLMVSRVRYPHFANNLIRGRKPFSYLVWLVSLGLVLYLFFYPAVAMLCIGYALSGPIMLLLHRRKEKRA